MKICIVGTGGVGGYFGGMMAKAGLDVTFVARGDHYLAIKQRGLQINSIVGDFLIPRARVFENIADIETPDLIIFSVKTYDTQKTATQLNSVVSKETSILTFQNGIDNDEEIKKSVENAGVFPGVAYVISARTAPGLISQTGGMRRLIFGDRSNPQNPKLIEIGKILKTAGIDAVTSPDITVELWKKYTMICAFSGLTAYFREPIGHILADPAKRKMYEDCIKEAISVAKSLKVNLPEDIFATTMAISEKTAPESKSSLLIDIENHRPTEIETLNGKLVRLAGELKIETPINNLIYQSVSLL